jgi:hypothetical protein
MSHPENSFDGLTRAKKDLQKARDKAGLFLTKEGGEPAA